MFFPTSVGLSIYENDLIISKVSQKFFKCTSESLVVKDFLLKDSFDLKSLICAQGYQSGEVVLSWPREKTIVREIELPGSNIKELKESISYQLDSLVLFSEEDVYYDIYPSKSSEYGEKAFVFAVKREDLDGLMSKLELSNIKPSRVVISPLSFIPHVKESKLIIINKCNGLYVFNLYMDSVLVSTSLIRTEDLLNDKIAETGPDKVILISKDGSDFVILDKDDIKIELWERSKESLGAAINGMSEYLRDFNVLKVKKNKLTKQLILSGILSFLIIAFAYVIPGIVKNKKIRIIRAVDAKLQQLHPDVTKIDGLEKEIKNILEPIGKLEEIANFGRRRIDLLAELTRVLPDNTWIKQLSFKRDYFEIEGIGSSGAEVLTLLENSPIFSHVRFTSSVTKDRQGNEKFKIKGNTR